MTTFVPKKVAVKRLGVSNTSFYDLFVKPGRIRLVKPCGNARPNAPSAVVEEELEQVMAEIIAERDKEAVS